MDPLQDPNAPTVLDRMDVGRVLDSDEFAVMLRLTYRLATEPGTPRAPSRTTQPLYLSATQARRLLLLLDRALQPRDAGPSGPTSAGLQ